MSMSTASMSTAVHPSIRPAGPPNRTRAHRPRPGAAARPRRRPVRTGLSLPGLCRTASPGRRIAAWAGAGLVALALVVGVDVVGPGGTSAGAEVHAPAPGAASVVARPGDTLWSIAAEHRGQVSIRRYVDALIDLNGGPEIQAGQRIVLP